MPLQNASAINRLPPELLGHVFSYISLQAPSDIANCRLVSRAFKVLSSPHLIPNVVFARRLGAVSKLCEILQHPYFRLHVTELEYDSSAYSEVTATSWDQYVEDYERAPRELENPEWLKRQDSVQHAREKISAFCKSACDERQDSSIWDGALADTHVTSKSSYDSAESSLTAREAFLVGCSTTFADYRQRFADQQCIRKEGIDMTILAAAFVRFPKLRSIVFTDYRSLARKGESYDVCCQRLFGRTLEPQHVGGGGLTGVPGDCLFSILDVLAEHLETHIESLVIGPPHQFEYTGENASELADPYYPQNPRYLDLSSLENISLGSESKIGLILGRLRYLRLVLCYSGKRLEEGEMHAQIHRFLESSAPQLSSLMVHMVYLFWGGAREVPRVDHDVHFDFFRSTLMPLHIPRLQSLSLRRWIFTAQEVKTLLFEHAATLRDLHLLDCLCGDDQTELARWGGQTLALTGVEISGMLNVVDVRSANPHGWSRATEVQWSHIRSKFLEREFRSLEIIWLGGRRNRVDRQQKDEILPSEYWWKEPAYG